MVTIERISLATEEEKIVLDVACTGNGDSDTVLRQSGNYLYQYDGLRNAEFDAWAGVKAPVCFQIGGLKFDKAYVLHLEMELFMKLHFTQDVLVGGKVVATHWDGRKTAIRLDPGCYSNGEAVVVIEPKQRFSGLTRFRLAEYDPGSTLEIPFVRHFESETPEELASESEILSIPKEARYQPDRIYFGEGYHGGFWLADVADHHFFFRVLAEFMEVDPLYTSNLEIEGYTWEVLSRMPEFREDLGRLRYYLDRGRVDLVGSYAQPYNLAFLKGEDVIRQIWYSKRTIKELFDYDVTTYSSQYDYMTGQLPQIFKGLGIKYVVRSMSNKRVLDKCKVWWLGTDGSMVQFLPKCITQRPFFRNLEEYPFPGLLERNREAGVRHLFLHNLRDMGGPTREVLGQWYGGHPIFKGMQPYLTRRREVVFSTYRDYFIHTPEPDGSDVWRINEPDPGGRWGYWGGMIQQANRKAENILNLAGRMASLVSLFMGAEYPFLQIEEAWKNLMLSENIVPWAEAPEGPVIGQWDHDDTCKSAGEWSIYWTGLTYCVSQEIVNKALEAIVSKVDTTIAQDSQVALVVFNPTSYSRSEVVSVSLPSLVQSGTVRMIESRGREVPCQFSTSCSASEKAPSRKDSEGNLYFSAMDVPALGYEVYRVIFEENERKSSQRGVTITQTEVEVTIENQFYRLSLDRERGGCIASLFDKATGRELFDIEKGLGNDLSAFFPGKERMVFLSDAPANVRVLSEGPLVGHVIVEGVLDIHPVKIHIYSYCDMRRIDFFMETEFLEPTFIGQMTQGDKPTPTTQGGESTERDIVNQYKKLRLNFPLVFKPGVVVRDLPFESVEAKANKFHALCWVDVADSRGGLAFIGDRTSLFMYEDQVLSNVMGFAGYYWYSHYTLDGGYYYKYSLLPHAGNWDEARLPHVSEAIEYPLMVRRCQVHEGSLPPRMGFMSINPDAVLLSSMFGDDGNIYLRLFSPYVDKQGVTVSFHDDLKAIYLVRLDEEKIKQLENSGNTRNSVWLNISQHEIINLGIPCGGVPHREPLSEVKAIPPPPGAREKAMVSKLWQEPVDLERWQVKDDSPQATAKKRFQAWGWEFPKQVLSLGGRPHEPTKFD